MNPGSCPPEPPVGTWMKDRFGGVTQRQPDGWGAPGVQPFGRWEAMWSARGPYTECGEWGREIEPPTFTPYAEQRPLEDGEQLCPDCRQLAVWRSESYPPAWYHEDSDSRWCDPEHDTRTSWPTDVGPLMASCWGVRSRVGAVSKHNADLWR